MESKKISIFLPIEIKTRELLAKVILAKFIISNPKKNSRCYIGSKSSIDRLLSLKKTNSGIFLYKGGLSINKLKKIKEKVEKFLILDEEIGPASINLEKDMPIRLWDGSEKYIDRYYTIGKNVDSLARKLLPKLKNKIILTGWPRVDLWKKEFRYIYRNSTENIRKKYGKFILFSSDFGYNSQTRIHDIKNQFKKSEWKILQEILPDEMNWAKNIFLEFKKIIKMMQELDERSDIPQIIIRPHPAEDLEEWKKISKSFKRIKVIYKDDISPWIYASSAVLHRGCTSAVQTFMAGINTGYIVCNKELIRNALPYKISDHLYDLNDIIEFCKKNIDREPIIPNNYSNDFNNTIHLEKKYAFELIAKDMLEFDITEDQPYHPGTKDNIYDLIFSIKKKIIGYVLKYKKIFFTSGSTPQKIYDGISKKEIIKILENFNINHNFKVRQVLKDCVVIEK
jgi:surface carbohydrate biosynthesis protein